MITYGQYLVCKLQSDQKNYKTLQGLIVELSKMVLENFS